MSKFYCLPLIFLILSFFCGCGEEPDIQVSMSASRAAETTLTVSRVNANLLREKPNNPMEKPSSIMMISQGDQLISMERSGSWVRIQHVLSGQIGWLHNGFIQTESRSKWWSADTDRARKVAEKIYKDKIFLENKWPIIHINIEERWNKLVLTATEGDDFPKNQAIQCSQFAIDKLNSNFPDWRDHQVFLDAVNQGEKYSIVMGDDKVPSFL